MGEGMQTNSEVRGRVRAAEKVPDGDDRHKDRHTDKRSIH